MSGLCGAPEEGEQPAEVTVAGALDIAECGVEFCAMRAVVSVSLSGDVMFRCSVHWPGLLDVLRGRGHELDCGSPLEVMVTRAPDDATCHSRFCALPAVVLVAGANGDMALCCALDWPEARRVLRRRGVGFNYC